MGDQQNENRNSCENPSATHPVCSLEKPTKKVIYNRSRIVHMDEMIRAILPKLDTDERESVNQCYQAWKMKQVKTHTLLHQLRSIVSSDVLQNEVERIRQDKWKRNKQSNTTRCSSQSRRLFPTTDCQHLAQDNSCDSTTENTSVATSREDETYHNTEESLGILSK